MQRLAINGFICERVKPSEQSSYMGLWVCVALIVLILRAGIRRLLVCTISASAIAMAARVVILLGCDSQCADSYAGHSHAYHPDKSSKRSRRRSEQNC